MDHNPINDALKLEELKWSDWVAAAEETLDQKLGTLAAECIRDGLYASGAHAKRAARLIVLAIDEVVTKAIAFRRSLAENSPELGRPETLFSLQEKIAAFTKAGVGYMTDRTRNRIPAQFFQEGMRKGFGRLVARKTAKIRGHAINGLESIPLEVNLISRTGKYKELATGLAADSEADRVPCQALMTVTVEPKKRIPKPIRQNKRYAEIDDALRRIAEAQPKKQEDVFEFLDSREVPLPRRNLFKRAGWLKGFQKDRHAAGAWLSQRWGRLGLPAFARGPKK